ncbi:MAG TPA: N-acetylmuramoyl-L-alanine amidase [Candidatus Tectomicrobia bacterium]|nr:N-acetylmuramoyl-L-alanine amidase [Candidatus Tectomicrobia bacterium]
MARQVSSAWPITLLILVAGLTWSATITAAQSNRTGGGKPSSDARAGPSSPVTTVASPLWLIRDIRHWSNPSYTRVVIDVDGEVQYRFGRLHNPDRLYVDLLGAQLAPQLQGRPLAVSDHMLKGVRAGQNQPDVARVVLDLKSMRDYHVFTISAPYRLVIDVKGSGDGTTAQVPLPPPPPQQAAAVTEWKGVRRAPSPPSRGRSSTRAHRWHVVIDAGHGGKDPGAIGPSGLLEKDVVLDIAKRLRALMQQGPQWRVRLTRDGDVFIPLEERTAIANATGADLFVSIHANAAERPDAKGIETYFLDLASDEQSMRVAARENATTLSKVSDLQLILRDLLMTSKRNESSLLAGSVQRALVQAPGGRKNGRDLGVKHAPFLVLMGAEMPSILVETGFMSNPGEERKLADPKYRAHAARAIFEGIKEYLASTDGNGARQVQR